MRRQEFDRAIKQIAAIIDDGDFDDFEFDSETPGLENLPPTTWSELEDTGILERSPLILVRKYHVTPHGWVEILRRTNQLRGPETLRRAGILAAEIKRFVEGRYEDEEISTDDLLSKIVQHSVPPGWAWNALKSDLLAELWPSRNMHVRFTTIMMSFLRIPSRFGIDDDGVLD
jgi:hypothetical protein